MNNTRQRDPISSRDNSASVRVEVYQINYTMYTFSSYKHTTLWLQIYYQTELEYDTSYILHKVYHILIR